MSYGEKGSRLVQEMAAIPSYLDYEAFLLPSFSPKVFASNLFSLTNDSSDPVPDLQVPLSRVLFDIQELDSHIDCLTTRSAIPLLHYTVDRAAAADRISAGIDEGLGSLDENTGRLRAAVIERHRTAVRTRTVANNVARLLRLSKTISGCVQLAKHLETQATEVLSKGSSRGDDRDGLVQTAHTISALRRLLEYVDCEVGPRAGLTSIRVLNTIEQGWLVHCYNVALEQAQREVKEFSAITTFTEVKMGDSGREAKSDASAGNLKIRASHALSALYVLSFQAQHRQPNHRDRGPSLMLNTLRRSIQAVATSSVAAIIRSFGSLPTLDNTLLEVTVQCQTVIALEAILSSTSVPSLPVQETALADLTPDFSPQSLLELLLMDLETTSLPSFYWLTMAGLLTTSMQDLVNRGGQNIRILKASREKLKECIRNCVIRSYTVPLASMESASLVAQPRTWEREAAVMIGAILGPLNH